MRPSQRIALLPGTFLCMCDGGIKKRFWVFSVCDAAVVHNAQRNCCINICCACNHLAAYVSCGVLECIKGGLVAFREQAYVLV